MDVMALHLESIRLDPLLQARVTMDQSVVIEYAEAMEAGDQFPPIVVFDDGTTMWLADGWHRVEAARSVRGMTQIAAEIREGTRRDAMLYGAGANANHGLRRTNRDKRLIVARLLTDAEWAQWSDREIARACHVSHPFVAKIRAELAQAASGNVSRQRTFERGGTVSTMDTAPIAAAAEARANEPENRFRGFFVCERAITDFLDARHGVRGTADANPEERLQTVESLRADDSGEDFDEFEPYIQGEYHKSDLRMALDSVREKLMKEIHKREATSYPGLNNDVCERDRALLSETEETRAGMRRVETFADKTYTVAWVPTVAEAEEPEMPSEPVKPSTVISKDGGVDGWTAEYGMAPDRLAPIWRLEQIIEQYLDVRHGMRTIDDPTLEDRLATVTELIADDFGEEFDEFEPYIQQPYRQGDLRQALNNVAEQLRQAIARMEAKPQNPWAPALTPRPREAREVDAEMAPWLITFERDTDSVLRAQIHAVRNSDHITRDLMPVPVDSMTIGATIANKHAALRALVALGDQVDGSRSLESEPAVAQAIDAVQVSGALDAGARVTWPGKEGQLVRWDAGGRIAVVCDEQGTEYRIPRFMVDVHDHENPGV